MEGFAIKAIYKCRLCGEVYHNGTVTGEKVALACITEMAVGIRVYRPQAPQMTEPHCCGGNHAGSIGLADFQGWEKEGQT